MKHQGKYIHLTGNPNQKDAVPFQHTNQHGETETIALKLNQTYQVGGLDENGKVIDDWVYDLFLTCDYNSSREKSKAEKKSEISEISDGGRVTNMIQMIN